MSAVHPTRGDEPMLDPLQPRLYNVVYCSRSAPGVDAADVERIIASSRRRNPAYGITGLLVFGSGVFFQWLEGPRDSVTALMETLKADPRHDTVVELCANEEVRERLFPEWDMEFVESADIREVLLDALDDAEDPKSIAALGVLLEHIDASELNPP
ncbi:MAG: BLUF domain-containing protein [Pseudomonadota bacterium]